MLIAGRYSSKTITLYCKPLEVIYDENGSVEGYKVLKVYEVEKHLLGENPASSETIIFSLSNVPDEIKVYFSAKAQGSIR